MLEFFQSSDITKVLLAAFFAILFLQSGIDKITDYAGNLSWLTGHFGKSPLKNIVPIMLITITILEVLAGGLSAVGAVFILLGKSSQIAYFGAVLSSLSIVMLFFGQRIAKDYGGAAGLVPYFAVSVIAMALLR